MSNPFDFVPALCALLVPFVLLGACCYRSGRAAGRRESRRPPAQPPRSPRHRAGEFRPSDPWDVLIHRKGTESMVCDRR
jgi:hypothetical protein